MSDRAQMVAGSVASLNLEGLQPSAEVLGLLEKWAGNGVSSEDLIKAEKQLLADATHAMQPTSWLKSRRRRPHAPAVASP